MVCPQLAGLPGQACVQVALGSNKHRMTSHDHRGVSFLFGWSKQKPTATPMLRQALVCLRPATVVTTLLYFSAGGFGFLACTEESLQVHKGGQIAKQKPMSANCFFPIYNADPNGCSLFCPEVCRCSKSKHGHYGLHSLRGEHLMSCDATDGRTDRCKSPGCPFFS